MHTQCHANQNNIDTVNMKGQAHICIQWSREIFFFQTYEQL